MHHSDPAADYATALGLLTSLSGAIARQERHSEVAEAVAILRLAVARAYVGRAATPAGRGGAKGAVLAHLRANLGEWVAGEELAAVSGIGEWARRVRELRVESGFSIEEDRGYYRLTSSEPDTARRDRWQTVTEVRESTGEPLDRVRLLFDRLAGQAVSLDELNRAARSKDGARLARRLRDEDQMPVEMPGDAPDLEAGEHRLTSSREAFRVPPSQRLFTEDVRARVFRRDRHTCSRCGRDRASTDSTPERPFYLLVRHTEAGPEELAGLPAERLTSPALLETSCNECFGR